MQSRVNNSALVLPTAFISLKSGEKWEVFLAGGNNRECPLKNALGGLKANSTIHSKLNRIWDGVDISCDVMLVQLRDTALKLFKEKKVANIGQHTKVVTLYPVSAFVAPYDVRADTETVLSRIRNSVKQNLCTIQVKNYSVIGNRFIITDMLFSYSTPQIHNDSVRMNNNIPHSPLRPVTGRSIMDDLAVECKLDHDIRVYIMNVIGQDYNRVTAETRNIIVYHIKYKVATILRQLIHEKYCGSKISFIYLEIDAVNGIWKKIISDTWTAPPF